MMKKIMLIAAACAALAACTKDKVQEETGFFKKGQQLTLQDFVSREARFGVRLY